MTRIKIRQEVEPFKLPELKEGETQQSHFESYCEEQGFKTMMEKLGSACNPLYFPYLLDYVGYDDVTDPKKPTEVARSTYVKAGGRVLMARKIAQALGEHLRVPVRLVMPKPEWMTAKAPDTAIATVEFRIEAKMGNEWELMYHGSATARRTPASSYDKFFIEKAETAARARAIASAGIGIDISGGMTSIEEMQDLQKMEAVAMTVDEQRAVDVLEMRITACSTVKEINDLTKALTEENKKTHILDKLTPSQTSTLRELFNRQRATCLENDSAKKS